MGDIVNEFNLQFADYMSTVDLSTITEDDLYAAAGQMMLDITNAAELKDVTCNFYVLAGRRGRVERRRERGNRAHQRAHELARYRGACNRDDGGASAAVGAPPRILGAPAVRAAFFDIDGTLVSFRTHGVAASAREALRRLRQAGVRLFIATGRSSHGVPQVIRSLAEEISFEQSSAAFQRSVLLHGRWHRISRRAARCARCARHC